MVMMGRSGQKGQSLVELVLITPLLLLILAAAYAGGMAMYAASNASDAIRQPAMKKLEMADQDGPVDVATVAGYANVGGGQGITGTIKATGDALDSVKFANTGPNNVAALLVGEKKFALGVSWLPPFNFTVTQPIQKNLLAPADAGGAVRRGTAAWVPGGAVRTPPYVLAQQLGGNGAPLTNLNCRQSPGLTGPNVIDALSVDTSVQKAYISTAPVAFNTGIDDQSFLMLSSRHMDECRDSDAALCRQEAEDYKPKDYQPQYSPGPTPAPPASWRMTWEFDNPPGGPGMKMRYTVSCSGDGGLNCTEYGPMFTKLPFATDPNHGSYFDESGKFDGSPGTLQAMEDACKSRKQAECALEKAKADADRLSAALPSECQAFAP